MIREKHWSKKLHWTTTASEKILLGVIGTLTMVAAGLDVYKMIMVHFKIELADLFLLFIYAEIIGMVGAFYASNRIPITLPLFIAMTAIARLIILQGKEMDASVLIYEASAIAIIALACLIIRFKPPWTYKYQADEDH